MNQLKQHSIVIRNRDFARVYRRSLFSFFGWKCFFNNTFPQRHILSCLAQMKKRAQLSAIRLIRNDSFHGCCKYVTVKRRIGPNFYHSNHHFLFDRGVKSSNFATVYRRSRFVLLRCKA